MFEKQPAGTTSGLVPEVQKAGQKREFFRRSTARISQHSAHSCVGGQCGAHLEEPLPKVQRTVRAGVIVERAGVGAGQTLSVHHPSSRAASARRRS